MNQYKHLIALDLSSYGMALSIINRFVDDDTIKVFEISPCGQSAILILVVKEINTLLVLKSEITSFFKSHILDVRVIADFHAELLPTYLSQTKAKISKSLLILEGSSVAIGLEIADKLLKENHILIDFRVVRTFPKNVILTISEASGKNLNQLLDINFLEFKKTFIDNVQPPLKSYYEI